MEQNIIKKIDCFLEQNKQAFIEDIIKVVGIPSVSIQDSAVTPFGEACRQVLDLFLEMGQKMGLRTKNYDYYCGTLEMGEGEKEIGIYTHLDVVPAGNGWLGKPFEAVCRDGYLFGRGVMDDKGPSIAGLYTMKCLQELGIPLKNRVRLFAGCSEETGMACIEHYLSQEKAPDFAFTPDSDFPVCIGEKGMLGTVLEFPKMEGNILTLLGGIVSNMVPDRAVAVLKSSVTVPELGEGFVVEQVEKGTKITAIGRASHAAHPEGSLNAIAVLLGGLLQHNLVQAQEAAVCQTIVSILQDCHGKGLNIAFEDEPSGKLTHICGKVSLKDGVVLLDCNIRYPVTLDRELLRTSFYAKASALGVAVAKYNDSPPTYIPADSPIIQAMLGVYKEVTGADDQPYTMGGGTYARHLPNAVAFGPEFPNAVIPGAPERGGVHMPDECCSIDALLDSIRIYVLAILEIDKLV